MAIAHAVYFRFPLLLFHQQEAELKAILVVGQENLAAGEVQDVCRWSTRAQRNIRIIKEVWRRGMIRVISAFVLRSNQLKLTSRKFLPEHNHYPFTNKLIWATRQTLTPLGLERVSQRSTQEVESPLAAKMSKLTPRVPWTVIQRWKCIFVQKMTSKDCQMR